MPLPKRVISPVYVSRDTLPEHLQLSNDLEGVTNGTLANIIRQLSSLSRHAEDMFGELYKEAESLHLRSSSLQARIDRLAVKVTQLDSTVEEVSLQDIHLRKAFKSSVVFDQQVVSKQTIPTAMADTYHQCDKPPPLDKLNVYRLVFFSFLIYLIVIIRLYPATRANYVNRRVDASRIQYNPHLFNPEIIVHVMTDWETSEITKFIWARSSIAIKITGRLISHDFGSSLC